MNKTYVTKEIISRVVDRLYQQGERIEVVEIDIHIKESII